MKIGQFAKAAGVNVETIRFYQRKGLLPIPSNHKNGYREYNAHLLKQLLFIRKAQQGGFTLAEIMDLLKFNSDSQEDRFKIQKITQKRIEELQNKINILQQTSVYLNQLLRYCKNSSSQQLCPILGSIYGN